MVEALKAAGGRMTASRYAIVDVLAGVEDHLTADQLAAAVHAHHPATHLSTVYRTLDVLEEAGVLDHVHLGHGRAVYHFSDDEHQHLVCEECGAVIHLPDAELTSLRARLDRKYEFTLRAHHFALLGLCQHCRVPS